MKNETLITEEETEYQTPTKRGLWNFGRIPFLKFTTPLTSSATLTLFFPLNRVSGPQQSDPFLGFTFCVFPGHKCDCLFASSSAYGLLIAAGPILFAEAIWNSPAKGLELDVLPKE